ncbi:hypothetical protein [Azospirillum lipoferum]|uniref:hypothetical protein n=1 Tax=Azospirillum lipoferum TaxID=193 RepID=UPI0005C9F310|nr:hypothetical protein [Azospirillum lipoferum]
MMIRPVLVDYNGIAFPADDDDAAALHAVLLKAVRSPMHPDDVRLLAGETVLIMSVNHGRRTAGVAYRFAVRSPPAGTVYRIGNRLTNEPYILLSIRHMVVGKR